MTNEKLLKPNTVLNLVNALKTLLQDLLLCDLINVSARFQKYSLSLRRYSTSKSSYFIFAKSLIDNIICQLLFIFLNRESSPKCS